MIFARYPRASFLSALHCTFSRLCVPPLQLNPKQLVLAISCIPRPSLFFFGSSHVFDAQPIMTEASNALSEASPQSMKRLDNDANEFLMDEKEVKPEELEIGIRLYGDAMASSFSLEERFSLISSIGECVSPEELRLLLEKRKHPICYDGFEPSGRMHIAQGVLKAINVNKLTQSGCIFVFWVADWFSLLNNKMGGDLRKIKRIGEYFIEIWKAVGMDMRNVRFLWASDEINKNSSEYWLRVMEISRTFNISRIKRCCQIMGRSEGDDQPTAQMLYPCMQCSDIYQLKADICQLGLDQRKVNMLAREYSEKKKLRKPIILSHPMMPGLNEGQEKMSKSDPSSAIYMEDTVDGVNSKIKKSFCPPCQLEENPCVAYVEMLVFPKFGQFYVKRSMKNGGDITYETVECFRQAYVDGSLHPGDLKSSLARSLNEMIQPVKHHFATDPYAKKLLAEILSYKTTR